MLKKARAASEHGDSFEAVKFFKKTMKANSKYADTAYFGIGFEELKPQNVNVRLTSGNPNKSSYHRAAKHFEEAVKLNPNYVEAYYYGATAYMYDDENKKGIEWFTKVIELDPKLASMAYHYRAMCKQGTRDKKGACEDFQKAKSLGNSLSDFYIDKACK